MNAADPDIAGRRYRSTGILTEIFLKNGNLVYAVEPNDEMRAASALLRASASAHPRPVRNHHLADQASILSSPAGFHWFDPEKARLEFARILRPGGWVTLVWNERENQMTPFLEAYEQLLQRYAIDYLKVDHRRIDQAALLSFYGAGGYRTKTFQHQQDFDFDGLRPSCSRRPIREAGHPNHEPMLLELASIFQAHQVNGEVAFAYTTKMYYGQLS
jgi:SAM-dependent methyltransferase